MREPYITHPSTDDRGRLIVLPQCRDILLLNRGEKVTINGRVEVAEERTPGEGPRLLDRGRPLEGSRCRRRSIGVHRLIALIGPREETTTSVVARERAVKLGPVRDERIDEEYGKDERRCHSVEVE